MTAVVALLLKAGPDSHYETTYSDIRYIVRYVPAVVGTISQLASRSVFFAFARIDPYLSMADSKHSGSKRHCTGDAAIAAPFIPPTAYPTHPFTTGRYLRFAAIISQLVTSYITAFKAGLLSSTALPSGRWIVTIHPGIALTLIGVYVVNISVMMWIFGSLWTHSTGLKWDPVTIADQVALFHGTNVFKDFEELELHPDEMAYKLLRTNEYRIGYWTKGVDETNIVYGIGRATLGTGMLFPFCSIVTSLIFASQPR